MITSVTGPHALPGDYDEDPDRFAANVHATAQFSRAGDVHPVVATQLAALGSRLVLDLGGGTGTLATALRSHGVRTVVVDRAAHVGQAPRPAVRADLRALPVGDGLVDAAACLWVLYHFQRPVQVLREAARVLRPQGWFVASTSARTNDPELASLLPGWGRPGTFDAEDARQIVEQVFDEVHLESWDAPLIHLPDRRAAQLFLRGRGLGPAAARAGAEQLTTPTDITKRGALVWARTSASSADDRRTTY